MTKIIDAPVIIVDDDSDDREFIVEAWDELNLKNDLIFVGEGAEVIDYLRSGKHSPFLIICDIYIPKMDGFQLKAALLKEHPTRYKSIPFVYWSSSASEAQIRKAYDLGCNGFFIKDSSMPSLKESLRNIVWYWRNSKIPDA